jgi:hypothetical protein
MQPVLQKSIRAIPRREVGFRQNQRFLARLRHFSILIYATESERVRRLLPPSFAPQELTIAGRKVSLISVISHLDIGSPVPGASGFEQTSYRLATIYNGREAQWLLGLSIGSLSALPARGLWLAPANLGAMEFKTSYNAEQRRYQRYRLSTQSRWENADWVLAGNGASLDPNQLRSFIDYENISDYFIRRDGAVGARQIQYTNESFQQGKLVAARSDLLTRLGLLTPEALTRPLMVALGSRLVYRFDAPHSDFGLPYFGMPDSGPAHRSIFAGEDLRSRPILGP